jgi:hypothetical protein
MKASRYMKPPSCHKPARVTVRDAGPALGRPETHQDTQHAAHLIGEIRASERGWEVTKGTTSPCPSRVKLRRTQCEQMFSGLPLKADIAQCSRHVSKVPLADSVRLKKLCDGP